MENIRCDDPNQDPDYFMVFNGDTNRQNIFENNARTNAAKKISKIIEAEFLNEINNKKTEIFKIYKNLSKACKMLHYLRFAIVTDFYNQENACINDVQALKQSRLHPTVKSSANKIPIVNMEYTNNCFQEFNRENKRKRKINHEISEPKKQCLQDISSKNVIVPLSRSSVTSKTKKRIIVGNISKWIPPDFREDNATHKWTIYVRDSQKSDIGQFISKVRFFLHPSYKPNDVVELTSPPFHLSRHGWGEFPARVQLHFINNFDKPVDIIHHLKLDRTFTGLQTIGSETIVDLWISVKDTPAMPNIDKINNGDIIIDDKNKEKHLTENGHFFNDHDYLVKNPKFDNKISPCLKEEKYVTSNVKTDNIENATKISEKNLKTLSDTHSTPVLINNTESNTESNTLENLSIQNGHNFDCDNNVQNSLNNSDIKNMDSKYDSHVSKLENSKTLISFIKRTKPKSLFSMLKLIASRMPLITEKATDPYYRMMYPYASESYQVFSNYSKGKQRSLEWFRAICALNVMKNTKYYENICTVKEFIIWARRYSYTPLLNLKETHQICILNNLENTGNKYEQTSTVSEPLNKWLLECQKTNPNVINSDKEDDNLIDVLNVPLNTSNSLSAYKNSKLEDSPTIVIKYPKTQNSLNEFVCKSAQKIGIKLTNEEIIPGVLHNTANLLMTKAVECLIDELIRLAFTCALDKSKSRENSVIVEVEDVRMALLKKEEFEIFTNAGLGSEG